MSSSPDMWIPLGWLLLCAIIDARRQRIPNWLVGLGLAGALAQLLLHTASFAGATPGMAFLAALLGLLLGLPGYLGGRFGAGDVKMLMVLGLASAPLPLLWTVVLASCLMLAWTALRRRGGRANSGKVCYAPFALFGFLGSYILSSVIPAVL